MSCHVLYIHMSCCYDFHIRFPLEYEMEWEIVLQHEARLYHWLSSKMYRKMTQKPWERFEVVNDQDTLMIIFSSGSKPIPR